jgi:hypothetical protein
LRGSDFVCEMHRCSVELFVGLWWLATIVTFWAWKFALREMMLLLTWRSVFALSIKQRNSPTSYRLLDD